MVPLPLLSLLVAAEHMDGYSPIMHEHLLVIPLHKYFLSQLCLQWSVVSEL